jgi:hypothetical protein
VTVAGQPINTFGIPKKSQKGVSPELSWPITTKYNVAGGLRSFKGFCSFLGSECDGEEGAAWLSWVEK